MKVSEADRPWIWNHQSLTFGFIMRTSLLARLFQVRGTLILRNLGRHYRFRRTTFRRRKINRLQAPRSKHDNRYLEKQELKQVEKALKKVWHQRFDAHDEAVSAILDALDGAEEPICRAVVEYIQDPKALKKESPAWMDRIH